MRRQLFNLFRFAQYQDFKGYKNNYQNNYQKRQGQQGGYQNSGYQPNSQNVIEWSIDVKNYNLMLPLDKFNMSFFLMPPSILKKGPNVLEIRKANAVLGVLFIPKTEQDEVNWSARKSFNFKLLDVGKLLYVQPGSGKSVVISNVNQSKGGLGGTSQYAKQLKIVDNIQKNNINISLRQANLSNASLQNSQPSVDVTIPHQQYRLFYDLIKAGLFQLSGWKLQMDLHKRDIMSKLSSKKSIDADLDNVLTRKGF